MRPKFITFTGLDEKTDLYRCTELAVQYPIEWGVLFGGRLGKNRYPAFGVVETARLHGLVMSMHLCGPLAARANQGYEIPHIEYFDRIQVNRRAGEYDLDTLRSLASRIGRQIIVQHRASTFDRMPSKNIVPLQDTSGGRGKLPFYWAEPAHPDQFVGYAGGLNPDNVADAVRHMPAANFWIDMETGVRTDDWLDLDKCEAVCRAVYGDPS